MLRNRWLANTALFILAFAPTSARACLNDRSTVVMENDFKSSYLKKSEPPVSSGMSLLAWSAIAAGAALTCFAGIATLRSRRR